MKKRCILLVDDDETQLRTFQEILQEAGYLVETATTGEQALDKVKTARFDLVVLDIKLPDILGDEVARLLRRQDEKSGIILMTGYRSFQDCIDALDIGINEILLKPIEPDELLRATKDSLDSSMTLLRC